MVADSPLISIVMSVYNGGASLPLTLKSLACQTFRNYELIIVDDGSTDNTDQVLKAHSALDDRIKVIRHENIGLTKSLNRGIREASGAYIARQDSGDISDVHRIASQIEFLSQNQNVALVGTATNIVDHKGSVLDSIQYPTDSSSIKGCIKDYNCICHGSVIFRRDAYEAIGGYREEFDVSQDYDLWLRFSEQYEMANLPSTLYDYQFDPQSLSFQKSSRQYRMAQFAKYLAEVRYKKGDEINALARKDNFVSKPITIDERASLYASYNFWVKLLLKHNRIEDALNLIQGTIAISPSPFNLFLFYLGKNTKSKYIISRILS